ncbi:MAG: VCBS repeat-containing protein [Planctomycetes bacterium]|nr:VCBS repeat-containing protein [Planctomycetota bacterium]
MIVSRAIIKGVVLALLCVVVGQESAANPFVIKLAIPGPADSSAGGIIAADVDNDGKMDYLVTVPGHLAAYGNDGRKLWVLKRDIVVGSSSESHGLPGHCGPGVAAGDMDGDGKCEVVFLTKDSVLHVVDGKTGREEKNAKPPVPKGAQRWELAMIADFRGTGGDRDILLQATNKDGYRMGKFLAAYSMENLLKVGKLLWQTDKFVSCAHNGARLADINGDGRDEVLGATIFSAEGKLLARAVPDRYHIDSVFVADVRPDKPGLEVILLEEGANQVQVVGATGPIWRRHFKKQEPQNAAVGRFKAGSNELFIWCRSRYNEHQKPFVFDSSGKMVFDYKMGDVAPPGWTASGVEIINTIDWTGDKQQLACAKERHKSGDVCLFEPLTGKFVARFKEKADRLYVADVTGDWREEIIVLNGNELHVYSNNKPNPRPNQKRLWAERNYRRLKQCYNYYSP